MAWLSMAPHVRWLMVGGSCSRRYAEEPYIAAKKFLEVKQLIEVERPDIQVHMFVEGDAEPVSVAAEQISEIFGLKPLWACPSDVCDIQRPRVYWLDWPLNLGRHMEVTTHEVYSQITLKGLPKIPAFENGAVRIENCVTLKFDDMVSARSKGYPPSEPVGLLTCSEQAFQRWRRDAFRYPPSRYEDANVVVQTNGSWRTLRATEREVRLGFPRNHTFPAWSRRQQKADARGFEDLRCSLVTQAYSSQMVAMLLGSLFQSIGFRSSPPSVDECWGGVSLEGQDALMQRLASSRRPLVEEVL